MIHVCIYMYLQHYAHGSCHVAISIFHSFIMSIDLLAHGVTPCLGTFAGQFSAILVKQNGWFNGEPRFIHH